MDLVLYYNSLGSDLQQLHLTLQMTQVFMAISDKSITDLASTTVLVTWGVFAPARGTNHAAVALEIAREIFCAELQRVIDHEANPDDAVFCNTTCAGEDIRGAVVCSSRFEVVLVGDDGMCIERCH